MSAATDPCYHCRRYGHWQGHCPLLQMPADRDHHEARIATIRRWFLEFEITPADRTRLIKKEIELWKERQAQMAAARKGKAAA